MSIEGLCDSGRKNSRDNKKNIFLSQDFSSQYSSLER
jgi:hypothetical protein